MPSLLLTSPNPAFATDLAARLLAPVRHGPSGSTRLRVAPGVERATVEELLRLVQPVMVEVLPDASVDGMVLDIGNTANVSGLVQVMVPPPWRAGRLLAQLRLAGATAFTERPSREVETTVASMLLKAVIGVAGVECGQSKDGMWVRAGVEACRAVVPAVPMTITGAGRSNAALVRALRLEGWPVRRVASGACATPGVFVPHDLHPGVAHRLLRVVGEHIPGLEPSSLESHALPSVSIELPHGATLADGALTRVDVRTDDAEAAAPFVEALRGLCGASVEVRPGLSFDGGFRVRVHRRRAGSALVRDVESVISRAIEAAGAAGTHEPNVYEDHDDAMAARIEVDLPMRAAADGALLRTMLARAGTYHLHVGNAVQPRLLLDRLGDLMGAAGSRPRLTDMGAHRGDPRVVVGSAPMEVARHVAAEVRRLTGVDLPVGRSFSSTDDDIWVVVPPGTRVTQGGAPPPASRIPTRAQARPFLEVDMFGVRVGDTHLPRTAGRPLAPAIERFAHTCVDRPTAVLLEHLVTSVRLREPVLLEGPTAAGKTSTILFLAALLGQPAVRLNLGGQTDVGELIGRYAPRDGGWAWQEGVVPKAMREGWWVILDEINLAEAAVIERLNPVLERVPSLVVSEGDGARFGPGGLPVAPGFHVFATMNPADGAYGGRHALSPALRDRFAAQLSCAAPAQADMEALLRFLVHGEQPAVELSHVRWAAVSAGAAPHGVLAGVPGIDERLTALAAFHASVDKASRSEDEAQRLGAGRREGFPVTRRTLLSVLDYLCARAPEVGFDAALVEALDRYYTRRAASDADAHALCAIAAATGVIRAREVA